MIDGALDQPEKKYFMNRFANIRAKRGGLLHTEASLGAFLKKGDLVARTVSVFGDALEEFVAPEDGVFIRATTLSTVAEGERVAALGVVE